jgi:hypothetical protein
MGGGTQGLGGGVPAATLPPACAPCAKHALTAARARTGWARRDAGAAHAPRAQQPRPLAWAPATGTGARVGGPACRARARARCGPRRRAPRLCPAARAAAAGTCERTKRGRARAGPGNQAGCSMPGTAAQRRQNGGASKQAGKAGNAGLAASGASPPPRPARLQRQLPRGDAPLQLPRGRALGVPRRPRRAPRLGLRRRRGRRERLRAGVGEGGRRASRWVPAAAQRRSSLALRRLSATNLLPRKVRLPCVRAETPTSHVCSTR